MWSYEDCYTFCFLDIHACQKDWRGNELHIRGVFVVRISSPCPQGCQRSYLWFMAFSSFLPFLVLLIWLCWTYIGSKCYKQLVRVQDCYRPAIRQTRGGLLRVKQRLHWEVLLILWYDIQIFASWNFNTQSLKNWHIWWLVESFFFSGESCCVSYTRCKRILVWCVLSFKKFGNLRLRRGRRVFDDIIMFLFLWFGPTFGAD